MSRQKENAYVLAALATAGGMAESGMVTDTVEALFYIGTFLADISKSLAIIADELTKGGDEPCTQ